MSIFSNKYSEFKSSAKTMSELELVIAYQDQGKDDERIQTLVYNEFVRRYNKFLYKKANEITFKLPTHLLGWDFEDFYVLMLEELQKSIVSVKREKISAGVHFSLVMILEHRKRAIIQAFCRRMKAKKFLKMMAVEDETLRNVMSNGKPLEDLVIDSLSA